MSSELTVLSAFTGLGGLDLGLEAAGFRNVGCIEHEKTARKSLIANRDWLLLEPGDICELSKDLKPSDLGVEVRELSLLAGAPPCQPFSKAAQWTPTARSGLSDSRSHCIEDFMTLLGRFLPKAFLIENVSGFVRGETSAIERISGWLEAINRKNATSYTLQHTVLDAADYGVPQRRRRALIVGDRDGKPLTWPERSHALGPATAWDAIGGMRPTGSIPKAMGAWSDLLPSIPEGKNYLWHTPQGGGRPLFGYRTRYWSFLLKLAKDKPSWTLPAHPGPATGPFHWDNRPLTISEMLRLQTFPIGWRVEGDYKAQVRQVGNATPPLLAEIAGRAIVEQLFEKRPIDGACIFAVEKWSGAMPGPVPTTPVPARFGRLEGAHPRHPGSGLGPQPRKTKKVTPSTSELRVALN